jgi:hypothetical protein
VHGNLAPREYIGKNMANRLLDGLRGSVCMGTRMCVKSID